MKTTMLVALLCLAGTCFAQTYTYSTFVAFSNQSKGPVFPGNLIIDSQGNLYGTSELGGAHGMGTVFKVSPKGVVTTLHSFAGLPSDGFWPFGPPVRDSAGNLYGITEYGGMGCESDGCGTIFKVTPTGKETLLYEFSNGTDGAFPVAGLARDTAGNLFGVSYDNASDSIIFKLTPQRVFSSLQTFAVDLHGDYLLIRNSAGDLFGNLYPWSMAPNGSVFELTPQGQETTLYTFSGAADGGNPTGKLTQDATGNLYGSAVSGGSANAGVAFKISTTGVYSVLYSFCQQPSCSDGSDPLGWITLDSTGNLYGVTGSGGTTNNGVFYKITPSGIETVLYNFASGQNPTNQETGLVMDKAGNFYGAIYGSSSIYKLTKN